jgi:hypothetical protein
MSALHGRVPFSTRRAAEAWSRRRATGRGLNRDIVSFREALVGALPHGERFSGELLPEQAVLLTRDDG